MTRPPPPELLVTRLLELLVRQWQSVWSHRPHASSARNPAPLFLLLQPPCNVSSRKRLGVAGCVTSATPAPSPAILTVSAAQRNVQLVWQWCAMLEPLVGLLKALVLDML